MTQPVRMYKILCFLKRREGMSSEEFRTYYEQHHKLYGERLLREQERGFVGAELVHERLLVGLAERHRAEAQRRDLHARRSEVSIFHRGAP